MSVSQPVYAYSVLFWGVHIDKQCRPRSDAPERGVWSVYTVCIHGSIKNKIRMKRYTRHPLNEKWTRPIKKDEIVHWTKKGLFSVDLTSEIQSYNQGSNEEDGHKDDAQYDVARPFPSRSPCGIFALALRTWNKHWIRSEVYSNRFLAAFRVKSSPWPSGHETNIESD